VFDIRDIVGNPSRIWENRWEGLKLKRSTAVNA
jgi:hypothetical protein